MRMQREAGKIRRRIATMYNFNPFELMKKMGTIEAQMKTIKESLAKLTATGSAGAGMVEVTINGEYQVISVNVSEIIIDKNEKEMLQVMIASAFNDASNKMRQIIEDYTKREAAKLGITP